MMRRARPAAASALLAALSAGRASAQTPGVPAGALTGDVPAGALTGDVPVDLAWNAPAADCPPRERVMAEVERILRGSNGPRAPLTASLDVRANAGHWEGTLRIQGPTGHGERTFEAQSCEGIASAAALILAVAVEGDLPSPADATERQSTPAPSRISSTGSSMGSSQLTIALAGAVDSATLPSLAGGGEATAGWLDRGAHVALRLLAGASLFATQNTTLPGLPPEGGSFSLVAVSARGCVSAVRGAFDLGPCLGAELEDMSAQGVGENTTSQLTDIVFVAGLASGLATWRLSRHFAVFGRADAILPFWRPSFVVDVKRPDGSHDQRPVHRPAWLSSHTEIGLEVRFF